MQKVIAFLCIFFQTCDIFELLSFLKSVATCLSMMRNIIRLYDKVISLSAVKEFKNQLRFDEVKTMSLWSLFIGTGCSLGQI